MTEAQVTYSFLITHYNRPQDLLQCITAIKALNLTNYEIVVSDDASTDEHLALIKTFGIDTLVTADKNRGLAANINKGLKACHGTYIIYCQEDFTLSPKLTQVLEDCQHQLDAGRLDLIRFTANYQFKKLVPVSDAIGLIPKFSFQNFFLNYYRYSDHPFITTPSFYERFGYYMEGTSGRYGETEYAIRICNSNAKLGILYNTQAQSIAGSISMLLQEVAAKPKQGIYKSIYKFARALRLYFEWLFYNKNKRGLITYKNGRA